MSICDFCQRAFSRLDALARHDKACKAKLVYQLETHSTIIRTLQQERAHLQQRVNEMEHTLQESEEKARTELRQAEERERQYAHELRALQDELTRQRDLAQMYHDQIVEIAKQPTHITHTLTSNHQRTVNIINQLGSYEFEEKRLEQILEETFTQDVFLGGPEKIAQVAAQFLLIDPESQKPRVVCTDISRKMYRYIDPDTHELQIDPGFQKTHRLIKRPLEQANLRVFYDYFLRNDPDDLHRDQWKKNDEFIEDSNKFPEKLHQFLKKPASTEVFPVSK
jgi:hypothetical protein